MQNYLRIPNGKCLYGFGKKLWRKRTPTTSEYASSIKILHAVIEALPISLRVLTNLIFISSTVLNKVFFKNACDHCTGQTAVFNCLKVCRCYQYT